MDKYTEPEWQNSVLLTIYMQEDFTREDAPACIPETEEILPELQRLLRHYRDQDRPILHIVRLYQPDGPMWISVAGR